MKSTEVSRKLYENGYSTGNDLMRVPTRKSANYFGGKRHKSTLKIQPLNVKEIGGVHIFQEIVSIGFIKYQGF